MFTACTGVDTSATTATQFEGFPATTTGEQLQQKQAADEQSLQPRARSISPGVAL